MENPSNVKLSPTKTNSQKHKGRKPSKDHTFKKRTPHKPERGENVIYVSSKSPVQALIERCNKLMSNNEKEIIIYCLGKAVPRGICLALQLCERHLLYQIHTNTISTELIDDLEPAADEADFEIQKRFNSALRIKLFQKDLKLED